MVRIVGDALTFIWNICDVFPRFHKEYGERGAVGAVAAAVVLNCSVWGAALEILGRNGFSALWAFPAVLAFFALEFALIRILFGTGGSSRHDWIAASAAGFSFSMAALLCIALRCHLSGNLFIWFFFLIWSIAAAKVAVTVDLPTPPLPDTTAITFFTLALGFNSASKLSCLRSAQSLPQEEQFPLQAISFCSLV